MMARGSSCVPGTMQTLAVDALYFFPWLCTATLRTLLLLCLTDAYPLPLAAR
jgi:hypothetical protein